MTFGEMPFGEMLRGELTVGEMAFYEMIFDESSGHRRGVQFMISLTPLQEWDSPGSILHNDVDLEKVSVRNPEIHDGGFGNSVTQILACIHDKNEIPRISTFPGSCNITRILRKQPNVCISEEFKMADCNRN